MYLLPVIVVREVEDIQLFHLLKIMLGNFLFVQAQVKSQESQMNQEEYPKYYISTPGVRYMLLGEVTIKDFRFLMWGSNAMQCQAKAPLGNILITLEKENTINNA